MKKPQLIIITGLPSTGKTTIGKQISEDLKIPIISKDNLKEQLFDSLGWSDREWSKKVGITALEIMSNFIEQELMASRSVITECNFKPEFDNKKFQAWQKKYRFSALQILCFTDGQVLFDRFKQRAESNERHPGHADTGNYEEFRELLLTGKVEVLEIKGKVLEIDTTDFNAVNLAEIKAEVQKFINS